MQGPMEPGVTTDNGQNKLRAVGRQRIRPTSLLKEVIHSGSRLGGSRASHGRSEDSEKAGALILLSFVLFTETPCEELQPDDTRSI